MRLLKPLPVVILLLSSDKINPLTLADILDEVNMQLPCFGINNFLCKQITTQTFIKENIPNTLHPSGRLYHLLIKVGFNDTDFTNLYAILEIITTILANAGHVHTNIYNRWIIIAKVICRVIDSIELLEKLHYTVFKRSLKWPDPVDLSEKFNTTITEAHDRGIKAVALEYDLCMGIGVVKVVDVVLSIENNKEPIIKSGVMDV